MTRHRASVPVLTASLSVFYRPRHCAGGACLHNHAIDYRPSIPLVRTPEQYAAEAAERAAQRMPWERGASS